MLKDKSNLWRHLVYYMGYLAAKLPLPPQSYGRLPLPLVIFGFVLITYQYILSGLALYLVAGCLEVFDKGVRRYQASQDDTGSLDGKWDHFIDFIIIFSYFWLPLDPPWLPVSEWLLLAYFFAIMPTLEINMARPKQTATEHDELILWRFVNRGEFYFLMMLVPLIAAFNAQWAGYMLVILTLIGAVTTLQMIYLTSHLRR